MAVINFDRSITWKTWFDNTNTLGSTIGNLTLLNAGLGSNLVNATNTVLENMGDITTLHPEIRPSDETLVDSMNNLSGDIKTFRISEGEPQAYDMFPIAVFGDETDFDAHGFVE
jgi:hypothetical protein